LIGDGPEKTSLEESAKVKGLTNVFFLGFQPHAARYLSLADVYLSTSRQEGLPLALIESLALGVPVVATDVTGNNEVVIHGVNGFLYPVDKAELAASYILKIRNDLALQKMLGQNAKKIFNEKFRLETMLKEMAKLYS